MQRRAWIWLLVGGLAIVLAGCNSTQPSATTPAGSPIINSFSSDTSSLPVVGGSTTLTWTGSGVVAYVLTVAPATGITVDGTPYSGAVSLGTVTTATLRIPTNSAAQSRTYTFTLTANGSPGTTPASKSSSLDVSAIAYQVRAGTSNGSSYGFSSPWMIAVDGAGNVWVTNHGNASVTEVPVASSSVPIVYSGLTGAYGIALDSSGNAWITSYWGNTVTEIPAANPASPVAYTNTTGSYGFDYPSGIAVDGADNVWVTNYNRGSASVPYTLTEIPSTKRGSPFVYSSGFDEPYGVAVDASGDVWVTNTNVTGYSVTEVPAKTPNNPAVYPAGTYSLAYPYAVVADAQGNVWVTNNAGNSVTEIPAANPGVPVVYSGSAYGFESPAGIALDGAGNVWVTNNTGNSVTEIPAASPTDPVVYSDANFGFNRPVGVAVDASGNVWVANGPANSVTELLGAATPMPFKVPLGP